MKKLLNTYNPYNPEFQNTLKLLTLSFLTMIFNKKLKKTQKKIMKHFFKK